MANAGYGFNTSKVTMVLTASEDANTMKWRFGNGSVLPGGSGSVFQAVADYIIGIRGGTRQGGKLRVATGAVSATGTITFSSFANNDTITINGVTFTGKTSGATGNQFNLGASDTTAAAAAVVAINASATANVAKCILASSSGAVITITSVIPGEIGNMNTLAISAHGSVSGARLTGGTENASITASKGIA